MEACGHTPVWTQQRVLRTNARGRHIYCERFKAWLVEHALTPGMSVAGLAMCNQVNANLLRRWMLLHRREDVGAAAGRTSRLLPVTVAEVTVTEPQGPTARLQSMPHTPHTTHTAQVAVEIELGGALVRVREGVSRDTLVQVIAALRGSPS